MSKQLPQPVAMPELDASIQGRWRTNIVGHGYEWPEDLLANPDNWRIHPKKQQEFMEGTFDEVGWLDEVKVNKNSGTLVNGHMRVMLQLRNNEKDPKHRQPVPVTYLDLTQEEERKALLTFDRIPMDAKEDIQKLGQLFEGINFTSDAVALRMDDVMASINMEQVLAPQTTDAEYRHNPFSDKYPEESEPSEEDDIFAQQEAAKIGAVADNAPPVRVVQLYLSSEQHTAFRDWLKTVAARTGKDNVTDAVYEAVRIAAEQLA